MSATPKISLRFLAVWIRKKKVCTCDTKQKELARYRHILEMRTLRNIIYKRYPSLEVSGGLDGLVVHRDQKGEAAEHTE